MTELNWETLLEEYAFLWANTNDVETPEDLEVADEETQRRYYLKDVLLSRLNQYSVFNNNEGGK